MPQRWLYIEILDPQALKAIGELESQLQIRVHDTDAQLLDLLQKFRSVDAESHSEEEIQSMVKEARALRYGRRKAG